MRESTGTHPADVPQPNKTQGHTDEVPNEADEEDLEFRRQYPKDEPAAPVSSEDLGNWAQKEKAPREEYRGEYCDAFKPETDGYNVPNNTGCARTEGVSKIPFSEKRKYLPQYAQTQKSREDTAAAAGVDLAQTWIGPESVITTSARADRLAKRNSARKVDSKAAIMPNGDGDQARLKQLCKRTDHLRLGRSTIHGWGLFSEAKVAANDMVIEFVGEVISQRVSEKREKKYLESGLGSSYLFSLNNGFVVDGTKRGNISRFINHSCSPNVASKIRDVDGSPRIFFFASTDIEAGEFSP